MEKDEIIEQYKAMNTLLLEMARSQKDSHKSLIKVLIVTLVCYTLLLISGIAGFFWYESQFEIVDEIVTTETITQEVSGEDSEINNVEGNLYKDNAVHNDGRNEGEVKE